MTFTNYTIIPPGVTVVIDGVGYTPVDMTGIPSTVQNIQWDGTTNTGRIEYQPLPDGTLPIAGSFSDPDDYYNQTQACQDPLVCYSISDNSTYDGKTFFIGSQLSIYQWPHPAIPAGFTDEAPPVQTLDYTSLFWTGLTFVWSIFNPTDTLAAAKSTSIDWVNAKAYTILQPSDWYVVRRSENNAPIPENWDTWRQMIRNEASNKNAGIAACASIEELLTYTTAPAFNTWTPSPA